MKTTSLLKSVVGIILSVVIATSGLTAFIPVEAEEPEAVATYQNPLLPPNQWGEGTAVYGFGDPYIMKHNGMYYLYPSTWDNRLGMRVWSSKDMVNWEFEDTVAIDSGIRGAYAPEVNYWNGKFYMYTSPGGSTHRVLTSDSPTGPFTLQPNPILPNSGHIIDGSVYVDDDNAATKYFLHSGGNSIEYGILAQDFLSATGKHRIGNATVTGKWTEGPAVFKRNGKYYMTYTGNHVLADNYMIEYAVGDSVTSFKEPDDNRLVINTEEGIVGLGHNSIVVGPDLDTRYMVYHSLVSTLPQRHVNIDRMIFNGEKLEVQGPTWWENTSPKLPDFEDRMTTFDTSKWGDSQGATVSDGFLNLAANGSVMTRESTSADYTAEFNMKMSAPTGESGAMVSYIDSDNVAYVYFAPAENKINLKLIKNGVETNTSKVLPSDYVYNDDVMKKLTVKKQDSTFDIYVDDRLMLTGEGSLGGGRISFFNNNCPTKFGYTAYSSTVNRNEDKDAIKPTNSKMNAVHANSTIGNFEIGTISDTNNVVKSEYIKGLDASESVTFKVNPQEDSYYSFDINAKSAKGAKIDIKVGDTIVKSDVDIAESTEFTTSSVRNIRLDKQDIAGGEYANVSLIVKSGTLDLYSLEIAKLVDIFDPIVEQSKMDFQWLDGSFTENYDKISTTDSTVWSTASYGSEYWGDYKTSADVTLKNGSDAGILVRLKYATDASDAKNGIGGCNSGDYHHGYYAFISPTGVSLGKQMFDWKQLASAPRTLSRNKVYNLSVIANGSNIKVYLDNELVIDHTDTNNPIMEGKVGMRCHMATADFQNFSVTHIDPATPLGTRPTLAAGATAITKNSMRFYSDVATKGYLLKDGGVTFNNSMRQIKGHLKDTSLVDGTISCDVKMPATGRFEAGLIVRAKQSAFGNVNDHMDGIAVQLERGAGRNLNIRLHKWENKAYAGTIGSETISDYFPESGRDGATAKLKVVLNGTGLKVYVDDNLELTQTIAEYSNDDTRNAIGVRGYLTSHTTITNFKVEGGEVAPKTLTAIAVAKKPIKSEYFVGENFSASGLVVNKNYSNGEYEKLSDYTLSTADGEEFTSAGTKTITVIGAEKTTTFTVNVRAIGLTAIEVTTFPKKRDYFVGQKFSASGMVVTGTYNNGDVSEITDYTITPATEFTSAGTNTITITSEGKIATFDVLVKDAIVEAISITKKPKKLTYIVGDKFSVAGLKVTATYNTGAKKNIGNYTTSVKKNTYLLNKGKKKITVSFGGKKATFQINVKALAAPKLKAKKSGKKAIKITAGKIKGASGYQYFISTKKNAGSKAAKTTNKNSYLKGKLKAKKVYYIKIRAYRKAGKKKVYSKFTKIKKIRM